MRRGASSTRTVPSESASPPAVASNGTTVSALVGSGAPVMIRTASPRAETRVERAAGGQVGDDAEGDGGCRARGRDVGESHREPVHRGVVEQRQVHRRAHADPESASEGFGERHGELVEWMHRGQDRRQVLIDGDHGAPGASGPASSGARQAIVSGYLPTVARAGGRWP